MYVVRDVFRAKAGKAKELISKLKSTSPHFLTKGVKNIRVMTDVAATFWTVVWEFEVEEIQDYFDMSTIIDSDVKVYNAMEGYQEYIQEGHREIFRIE
jgi:hypothetical protein